MTFPHLTLRTLFAVVLLVAVFLGTMVMSFRRGTQVGFERGYADALRTQFDDTRIFTIRYPVGRIIRSSARRKGVADDEAFRQEALTQLIGDIKTTAKPLVWDHVGGYAEIIPHETDLELEINCTMSTHLEVSRLLDKRRGAPFGIRPPTKDK